MSSKVRKSAESKRRLYPKKSDVTPPEKRSNPNPQNQKTKSVVRNLSKDQKRPMSKQELIRQNVELLDELQRLKDSLETAQETNKKLRKDLKKLKNQNSDQINPILSKHRNYNSKYSDQAEESIFSDDQDYNDYNQVEEEEEREDIPFDGYEEDEEDRFSSSGSI